MNSAPEKPNLERPRPALFRAAALAVYQGPTSNNTPLLLTPWRPRLVIAAAMIALFIPLLWMIP